MNKKIKILASGVLLLSLASCGNNKVAVEEINTYSGTNIENVENTDFSSLNFEINNYSTGTTTVDGKTISYRAYENIVYVKNPVDTTYQTINIYIPEAYFSGESINGYTKDTAPVFFPNKVGGYMPAKAGTPTDKTTAGQWGNSGSGSENKNAFNGEMPAGMPTGTGSMGGGMGGGATPGGMMAAKKTNTIGAALIHGYVVASPGTRGRTTQDENGVYTGKAPAVIVDLLAAVRYLNYNDSKIPGDGTKIISNGTSAGGAVSTLLGSAGGTGKYDEYLEKLGAAPANDKIFAISAYCPITNLEHADMAYEWLLSSVTGVTSRGATSATEMSQDKIELSKELAANFPEYVNSLNLKDSNGNDLTLDKDGNGSFRDYLKSYLITAAQKALDTKEDDLTKYNFITIKNGKVIDIDMNLYVKDYLTRMKETPAFDALDLSSAENSLFGNESVAARHFTDIGLENSSTGSTKAPDELISLMNPMDNISTNSQLPKYWRIRHGAKDSDTSSAIPLILATTLENKGYSVDFALPWTKSHAGDYDLDELFAWIDGIVKK